MVTNKELKLLEKKFRHRQERYFFPLANAYRERNNLDKCISLFRQGLLAFPHYWAARVALGRALMERGDLDEALQELEAAVEQVPENLLLRRLLTVLYFKRGELSKAAVHCRIVLLVIPDDRECSFIMNEISKMQASGSQTAAIAAIIEETKKFSPEPWQSEPEEAGPEQEKSAQQPEHAQEQELQQPEHVQEQQERSQQPQLPERAQKKQVREEQEEILTPTIAELYLSQGFAQKAIEIYQELLIRQPDCTEWVERIRSIQKEKGLEVSEPKALNRGSNPGGEQGCGSSEKVLQQLETWLKNIEKTATD